MHATPRESLILIESDLNVVYLCLQTASPSLQFRTCNSLISNMYSDDAAHADPLKEAGSAFG